MSDSSVLIAEDEAIVATHLAQIVKKLGYKVAEIVSSGTAAVSKAAQLKPDAVLMDIRLEGEKDGVMAAQVIDKRMGTPVIFVTANTDPQTVQRARGTNPAGYVIKPFSEDKLAAALEKALTRPRGSADVEFKGRAAILLVDPSTKSRTEVVKALGQRHRVILSTSFEHAVQLLSSRPFDLILIDVATPDAGGHGAIRKLRRDMSITIPIVVLSEAIDQNTVAFLKLDVEGFVNKSTGLKSRIAEEVARILGR
jgi:CheY-like chemotaxis protein